MTFSPRESVAVKVGSVAASLARRLSVITTGVPTTSAPCRPTAAVQSAALNFQSGKWLCTISNPGAIHSTQASTANASSVTGTGALSLNTTSGSMRGCTNGRNGKVALPSRATCTEFAQVCAHIGCQTP